MKRTGRKRTYSKVRKPTKFQRKRIKLAGKEGFTVSPLAEKPTLPPVCVSSHEVPAPGPTSVVNREVKRDGAGHVLTYDKLIKDPGAVPFRFELPPEVEDLKLY